MTPASGDDYYHAAKERLDDARHLIDVRRYVLAMYTSGVAVECGLRSLGRLKRFDFGGDHDLFRMMTKVSELGFYQKATEDSLYGHVSTIRAIWSNGLRYADKAAVLRYLKRKKLDRKIKGDVVKYRCNELFSAASAAVNRLEVIWQRSKTN